MSVIITIVAAFTFPCKGETNPDMKRIKCSFTLKSIFCVNSAPPETFTAHFPRTFQNSKATIRNCEKCSVVISEI